MRALLVVVAAASAAHAAPRDAPTEIELDRDDAPVGRAEFGFDSGAPVPAWGIGIRAGWIEDPIIFDLRPINGMIIEPVVRRQTLAIGGALAINSAVVDARIGGGYQFGDRLIGTGSMIQLDHWVPSDLRLGVRLRVVGDPRNAAFVRADLTLPTGDEGDFAGDPSWTLAWRLIARWTLAHEIVVSATVGLRLRGEEVIVGDRLVGNEFLGAAGIALPLPPLRRVWCEDQVRVTAEVAGVLGDDVGGTRGPSPVEARAGVVVRPRPQWTIAARAGTGLTDEIGSPSVRLSLDLVYQR